MNEVLSHLCVAFQEVAGNQLSETYPSKFHIVITGILETHSALYIIAVVIPIPFQSMFIMLECLQVWDYLIRSLYIGSNTNQDMHRWDKLVLPSIF